MLQFGDSVYEAELRREMLAEAGSHGYPASESTTLDWHWVLSERTRCLMARLGDLLVDLGCELQTRYA